MQAKDFYEIGKRAYNGDEQARIEYFEKLSSIVIPIAKVYGLLPSYVMAKSVTETGYMTDLWNATAEQLSGKQFKKKAQDYNNIFCMNNWKENQEYLDRLPLPKWASNKKEFHDWGTHGYGSTFNVKYEAWKEYECIEDAIEDWCANIRCQSEKHGFNWNPSDLKSQLLVTESYTPEGSPQGVRQGLHYSWQENIMQYYEKYNLQKYDKEVEYKVMGKVEMTEQNLDAHIKMAYEYARANCHYAPCLGFPPMSDGRADCVGIALRALYTMGYVTAAANIDQIGALCKNAGMKMSTDINDVWKHHGVVLMQGNHLYGTPHVTHVYYSLGGTGLNNISKYDLGSDDRIKKDSQPYILKPVNEWTTKYHFLAFWYAEKKVEPVKPVPFENKATGKKLYDAVVRSKYCVAREFAGKTNKLLFRIPVGEKVPVYGATSTTQLNRWLYVKYKGKYGWVISRAFEESGFKIPKTKKVVTGDPDNALNCRIGAGTDYKIFKKIKSLPNGKAVRVINELTAANGSKWTNVYVNRYCFFVSSVYLK